jgi:integrase
MGSVRKRSSGYLYLDFYYRNIRCREYSKLKDSPANKKKLDTILKRIEAEITLGVFDYSKYFPNGTMVEKFKLIQTAHAASDIPLFEEFAQEWFEEATVQWKDSYANTVEGNMHAHLIPHFAGKRVSSITRADILKFRSTLAKEPGLNNAFLSPSRINHVMTTLRQILNEAADRYDFSNPFKGIKPLKVPKTIVDPLTLEEVNLFLETVQAVYRNYYSVRFFTGLRTCEIDGLKWRYVDLENRLIQIRETLVEKKTETPKTAESLRDVQINSIAFEALIAQYKVTGDDPEGYVFLNSKGQPIDRRNVRKRIWYPTLTKAGLRPRRPYQTRHTTATLWLASGEAPEWIARQMGHSSTEMLFRVYSRFVPNLTRQDGSAFERLLAANFTTANNNKEEKHYG